VPHFPQTQYQFKVLQQGNLPKAAHCLKSGGGQKQRLIAIGQPQPTGPPIGAMLKHSEPPALGTNGKAEGPGHDAGLREGFADVRGKAFGQLGVGMEKEEHLALCRPRSGVLLASASEWRTDYPGPGCRGHSHGPILAAAIDDDYLHPWLTDQPG
jgi:hypothetical protein